MCFSNLQKKIFQKAILNLKFRFPANNSKQKMAGNLNFKLRIVFWYIFFWDLEIWKMNRTFWKKPPLIKFIMQIIETVIHLWYNTYLLKYLLMIESWEYLLVISKWFDFCALTQQKKMLFKFSSSLISPHTNFQVWNHKH